MIDTITEETITTDQNTFLKEVLAGLKSLPKTLPSKYFYDKKGDKIFQKIMELDDYYLTRAEFEIFETQKDIILKEFSPNQEAFNLVEFGAGDGYKTKVLLKHFLIKGINFEYLPIDISQNALDGLTSTLHQEIPDLKINALCGDYFEVLDRISHSSTQRNVILFLGSNIGNFTTEKSHQFLSKIRSDIQVGDQLMIGIDLKKDPAKILSAYNDSEGVTESFNMNLLVRMNEALGANFQTDQFMHYPHYDPATGECKSSLISLQKQEVQIGDTNVLFDQWEAIHTETSRKYSIREIHDLAHQCGFKVKIDLTDQNTFFTDSIWEAV